MPTDAQRKRCKECKRVMTGTRGKAQWCETCGGEMRPIVYGQVPARGIRR